MIDFNNTQKAYSAKSKWELYNAYILFRVIKNQKIVNLIKWSVELAQKIHFPMAWAVKPTLYKQFVGGENLVSCTKTLETLSKFNIKSVLDYSAEGGETPADIQETYDEIVRSIEYAKVNQNIAYTVFKPSGLITKKTSEKIVTKSGNLTSTEKAEYDNFVIKFNSLCQLAYDYQIRILVDAEDYTSQPLFDELAEEAMRKHNNERVIVFQTFQMYRKDRLEYLKALHKDAIDKDYFLGVKFVRGAYMEKERELAEQRGYPSPIHETKADTDKSYDDGIRYVMENIDKMEMFNGTHNYESNQLVAELIDKMGLKRDDSRIYSSQLFGMSDNISFNMAAEGYNVCKYIPYAPVNRVLPYLLRRAQENTSTAGQTTRELELLEREIKRRKNLN